jgi:glyoxylase-like metal-dependent hydrolase (beta-lactamase superfamily II)
MVKEKDFEFICEHVIVLYDKIFPLYIVKGEKNFLIDAGAAAKAPECYERINKVLAETSGQENEKIDTLILTHSHWDHTGGSFYLQQKYKFNVIASRRTVHLLQKKKVVTVIDQMNQEFKKFMNLTSDTRFDMLKNLGAVGEGDSIPISSDRYFEVIESPGHTKCSLAFLLHPEKILFPGDTVGLMEPDGTIRPVFFSSYTEYEHSLKRIIDLEVEVLAFPHNRFIRGKEKVEEYLEKSLVRTHDVKEKIRKFLEKEQDSARAAEALYEQEFPEISFMGPREVVMVNLEPMVKSVSREFPKE